MATLATASSTSWRRPPRAHPRWQASPGPGRPRSMAPTPIASSCCARGSSSTMTPRHSTGSGGWPDGASEVASARARSGSAGSTSTTGWPSSVPPSRGDQGSKESCTPPAPSRRATRTSWRPYVAAWVAPWRHRHPPCSYASAQCCCARTRRSPLPDGARSRLACLRGDSSSHIPTSTRRWPISRPGANLGGSLTARSSATRSRLPRSVHGSVTSGVFRGPAWRGRRPSIVGGR